MHNPLMNYFFQVSDGRPMRCPMEHLELYFTAAEQIFGLPAGEAERVLLRTHLASDRIRFWSERLTARFEDNTPKQTSEPYRGSIQ
jgi:hypothetical protein